MAFLLAAGSWLSSQIADPMASKPHPELPRQREAPGIARYLFMILLTVAHLQALTTFMQPLNPLVVPQYNACHLASSMWTTGMRLYASMNYPNTTGSSETTTAVISIGWVDGSSLTRCEPNIVMNSLVGG